MRKITIAATLCALLLACGKIGTSDKFSQAWEVIERRPDSARVLLADIEVPSLSEGERAEYGLLMTMVDIKTRHDQIKNDSMIAASVRYYDQHGDKWHQAMAYHYRGVVKYALKNVPEAIKDLKRAETLAETLDDELLRNKIYERLAYCNYWSSNSPLLLKYSQKLLNSSKRMNDSVMVARSYLMVASGFDGMGMRDSAIINLLKSLDWIDALNDSLGRNDILDNVAMMYQEAGDVEKAEQYLTEWVLKHSSRGRAYATLACIRQKQGRYEEAVSCAKKSLEADDYKVHKQSLDLLAELYSQMGDSSRAYAMQRRSKEFTDSLTSVNKASQMADWQMKFDEQQRENMYLRKVNWLLGIIISLVLISIIVWWWNRRRMNHLRFRLDENIRQITQYQKEIDRLEQSGEAHMQKISQLKEQISQRRERISAKLLTGANLFNQIKDRQSLAGISANDQQSLVDYFAQLRPKRWQEWESQYNDLSTAQYIFLILQDDLHYDDETIATILDLKRPSVRSMRSRIKGKTS